MAHWNHTTCLRTLTEQRDERREVSKPLVSRAERVDEHHCVLGKVLVGDKNRRSGSMQKLIPNGIGNAIQSKAGQHVRQPLSAAIRGIGTPFTYCGPKRLVYFALDGNRH